MKLRTLLKDLPDIIVKGQKDIEITGISSNSKQVAPGNLFIARKGVMHDGNRYVPEAIHAGATAILTDIYDPSLKQVTQLLSPHVHEMEACLAFHYHQKASESLWMVGITGTNGKTTTSYLVRHILEECGQPCGLIGSIEYVAGEKRYMATRTTPDVCLNHKLLREMVVEDCTAGVMEVTSHALDQGRVAHIEFDVAVFTNLSHEHLDYHKTMSHYAAAKSQLFSNLKRRAGSRKVELPLWAVVNRDDPHAERMTEGCHVNLVRFGMTDGLDLTASELTSSAHGSHFTATYRGERVSLFCPILGRHNVYNALAALGVGIARGLALAEMAPALATFQNVPGRLERIENPLGVHIFVDYAHKPEALKTVLETVAPLTSGRRIVVFGCGGDRDREKRPQMAKIAESHADVVIVTNDNPRSENAQDIAKEITSGFCFPQRHHVELSRERAIAIAIQMALPGDVVLIAGKGNEQIQIIGHQVIAFDDRMEARKCVEFLAAARRA